MYELDFKYLSKTDKEKMKEEISDRNKWCGFLLLVATAISVFLILIFK